MRDANLTMLAHYETFFARANVDCVEIDAEVVELATDLRARGHLRVYCEVSDDPTPIVTIRALGIKDRNRVRIGDQSWESASRSRHEAMRASR